jgi:hypothetical protein
MNPAALLERGLPKRFLWLWMIVDLGRAFEKTGLEPPGLIVHAVELDMLLPFIPLCGFLLPFPGHLTQHASNVFALGQECLTPAHPS